MDNDNLAQLNNIENFFLNSTVDISLAGFILSIIISVFLGYIIKFTYLKNSQTLSNKLYFSDQFITLAAVTCLVITVIKFSLALSLGLVGALSIVRFRTPIKEPEELIYLFLAIAIGLGFGAGQILPSGIITISIFLIIWFFVGNQNNHTSSEYNLVINCDQYDKNNKSISNEYIIENLNKFFKNFNLVKYESNQKKTTFVIRLFTDDIKKIDAFKNKLQKELSNLEINYYYSNSVY